MIFKNSYQKQDGFTLTEIMVVVAIIGILAAIAVPNFFAWLPGYRLKSATRDLQGHLQTAKLEAVQRGGNVAVVVTPGVFNPAGRIGSYQVFVDTDADFVLDAGELSLRQVTMPADVSLTTAVPANITFNSRGLPNAGCTITLQNSRGVRGQAVMNLVGRVTVLRSMDNGVTYQQWD